MPGKPSRFSSFSRHHVNVEVSGILAAKRDPLSVRREVGIRCLSLETRQTSSAAARARHGPNIICVSEGNLRRAHCRRAEQTRLSVRRLRLRRKPGEEETAEPECCEQYDRAPMK